MNSFEREKVDEDITMVNYSYHLYFINKLDIGQPYTFIF